MISGLFASFMSFALLVAEIDAFARLLDEMVRQFAR